MEFSKRDLALLLPDQVGDAVSLRFTHDETADEAPPTTLQPKIDPSKKVIIYRAGQIPNWGKTQEEIEAGSLARRKEKGIGGVMLPVSSRRQSSKAGERLEGFGPLKPSTDLENEEEKRRAAARAKARARVVAEAEVIGDGQGMSDDELEGAYQSAAMKVSSDNHDLIQGDIDTFKTGQETQEEEEEDVAARRARIRARLKVKSSSQAAQVESAEVRDIQNSVLLPIEKKTFLTPPAIDEEEKESDEWETDSGSDEEMDEIALLKPVFVPKEKRETVLQLKTQEEAARARAIKESQELEQRKRQTRQLVAEEIRRDQDKSMQVLDSAMSDSELPDDVDDPENLLEFEAWKVREMQRLTRDKEEREALVREKAETERRRNLTEEERRREDRELGKMQAKSKSKWTFMQKYYHQGVFYMDEDSVLDKKDVRLRDNTAPTGEDKFNKEALPKVMQVRNFGRSGQSKWTHLSAEDTTNQAAPFLMSDRMIRSKMEAKMAGVGNIDTPFQRRKPPPAPPLPY